MRGKVVGFGGSGFRVLLAVGSSSGARGGLRWFEALALRGLVYRS